ncbi:hypothetical protein BJ166DRAFT_386364 [Pestalotiopsis sp. NC0098]|nr:hypothetical protein BJ166DRAFT_386364 [Pestalotiopsis sp. NC0098]
MSDDYQGFVSWAGIDNLLHCARFELGRANWLDMQQTWSKRHSSRKPLADRRPGLMSPVDLHRRVGRINLYHSVQFSRISSRVPIDSNMSFSVKQYTNSTFFISDTIYEARTVIYLLPLNCAISSVKAGFCFIPQWTKVSLILIFQGCIHEASYERMSQRLSNTKMNIWPILSQTRSIQLTEVALLMSTILSATAPPFRLQNAKGHQ